YNGEPTLTAKVTEISGGNFEKVNPNAQTTITVNDTEDVTTVTLNDVTVNEGTGTAKITATIDNAPTKGPLVITLSNGATVTFAVGATTAESTPFNIQGDDAYNDGESYSVKVDSYTGGSEFEKLVTTDTATVTVNDTTNTVYVDVTASSTNLMEGAGVTYTVTLRNQDGLEVKNHGGLNITLSNGVKITIPAGQDSATSSEVKAPLGSNTIKVQTIVETAIADSGKQFEDIQSGKTVTVNASSSTLKNDTAIATENGSENIASEDSLDTINGKNDGQIATGNVLANDDMTWYYKSISKITFEGKETIVKSYGNTEIVGKYGTLNISSNGEYTYKVNDDNSDVDALNVGDKLAEYFTYTTSNGKAAVLTVEVEGRNDAPIISTIETNGVTLTGIYNDYQSDNISENITAKDLIKKDGSNSYQFKNENNTLKMDLGTTKTNVDISYEGKNAGYKSILGYYEKNADGTIGNLKIIFVDGSDTSAKSIQGITGEIGFFLIPNGANNTNIMNIINGGNYQVERTEDGKIIFSGNGKLATASDVYYTDESLSTEKKDHTIALKSDNPNSIIIGFEDQPLKDGSTDFDYNDFVISVKFTPSESLTNKLFKNVDFSDVDDDNLSEATVTLTNAIDGDKINIAGDLKEGITYTTEYKDGKLIIKFSGIASHEAYEEALEAIRFSTKNSENERELKFEIEIKDPNGKTDKNSVVIIGKGFDNDTPTIGDERVETKEDISYTFSIKDFDSYKDVDGDSIETIKIVTLPDSKTEGTLKYDGVIITAGKEILVKDLGKLVFEPVLNSHKDASFTFQVSDSRGAYSDIKTMTVGVEAVADAPMVSIDIKSAGTIEVSVGNSGNGNSGGSTTSFDKVILTQTVESSNNNQNSSIDKSKSTTDEHFTFGNINSGTKTIETGSGNDEIKVDASINGLTISTGSGDDYIKTDDSIGNNAKINLGDGNDTVEVYRDLQGTIEAGAGADKIIIGNNVNLNSVINTGSGNDYVQINSEIANNAKINLGDGNDGIRILQQTWNTGNSEAVNGGAGFDTLYLNGNHDKYLVYIKSTDAWVKEVNYDIKSTPFNNKNYHVISWETYAKLNEDANGEANREFYIMKVSDGMNDNKALKVTNFESISFDDKTFGVKEETSTVFKYDISLSAQLTDTDGSEKLSDVTLKNIPEGSKLFGADGKEINAKDNGTYTVKVDENGEAKLTLTNENEVSDTDLNSIKASATSNEVNENDEVTDSATSTVDNILSTDINLDNLSSIISENGEINLANGKAENISLTLDDVLKISGEDNTIKISGDEFDSVTFKNTVGDDGKENAWSKTEGTGADKGYDIYMNSGDPTVQVKVEQPISDGITN
ncbi:immunoglobulin-like domain-containing protein, partial [Aliarcobacter butzleri]|uniref:immunoglobulin-like domain-containing protein n=1 Tax=Aliarcobacter butzleri TaxID=28197 RepID=UPI0012FAE4C7